MFLTPECMKKVRLFLVFFAAVAMTISATAQGVLTGRVVDGAGGGVLAGAVITNTVTGDVAVAGNDGSFRIRAGAGVQTLDVSYLGYLPLEFTTEAGSTVLGDLVLQPDAISVADIVVTAGIVTADRLTPVAVSNVTRAQIDMKLSSQEFPEILKSTPSVYATKQAGGYGDSRISMRGFNNNNVGVLINGVPVNDMENGRVYWSNWAGLSEVTSFMQVQRGLGASKLGISSVGGTINIITRSTDAEAGGNLYYGIGNDGLQKLNFSISTGLTDNGWALTLSGGRQSADGYIRGTNYLAWNYFGNLSKVFAGGRHRLSLTAFGAPQWHNQRFNRHLIEDFNTHKDGRRMNLQYGYIGGEILSTNYNVYHKPQISLVHTWEINLKSMLSTSVYASFAKGGGRTVPSGGEGQNWLYLDSVTGRPKDSNRRTADGLIDWESIFTENKGEVNGSKAVLGMSMNSHDWYGILSSYNNQLTDRIKITGGFDGRYYRGYHYVELENLLGGDYLRSPIYGRDPDAQLHEGALLNYDELGEVGRAGVFAQAEYTENNFSAFLSGSVSGHFIRYSNFTQAPVDGTQTSDWLTFTPWSVKGGASYKLGRYHSVFANGGYFTIAPQRANAFVGYGIQPNSKATMEKVTTAEAGYTFANNVLNVTVNGYYTLWHDMGMKPRTGREGEVYNILGINARHMGLELEATYRPTTRFSLKAMGSLGDWIWQNDVRYIAYNETTHEPLGDPFYAYIGGVHVGDAAQITAALAAEWEPLKNLRVGADFNWFGKNFAYFDPTNRGDIADRGLDAWQLPDYATVDLSMNYSFPFGEKINATIYGNVNNLFDTWYIADANDGVNHDARTALVYYGFGRTWTAGIKFKF
jgi:hypothetical protein